MVITAAAVGETDRHDRLPQAQTRPCHTQRPDLCVDRDDKWPATRNRRQTRGVAMLPMSPMTAMLPMLPIFDTPYYIKWNVRTSIDVDTIYPHY